MFVLGIDAGGTKTVCYLANESGAIVGEGRGAGANLQAHGELEVEKVLHAAIEEAIGARSLSPSALCLGIAGVDRADDERIVRALLRRLGFRQHTVIVNDALVALVAGVGMAEGVVLIAGTGSIAYGVNQDGFAARAGGWGHVLGDEGSGYWIGREALAAVMREGDGRGARTHLSRLLLAHFEVPDAPGLVREIYDARLPRAAIAALGPIVEQARAAGDVVAGEILRRAALELTQAVRSVTERLHMRGERFHIVLAGGVFRVVPWLAHEVTQMLRDVAPRATSAMLDVEPARGAVLLAQQELASGVRVPPYLDAVSATSA